MSASVNDPPKTSRKAPMSEMASETAVGLPSEHARAEIAGSADMELVLGTVRRLELTQAQGDSARRQEKQLLRELVECSQQSLTDSTRKIQEYARWTATATGELARLRAVIASLTERIKQLGVELTAGHEAYSELQSKLTESRRLHQQEAEAALLTEHALKRRVAEAEENIQGKVQEKVAVMERVFADKLASQEKAASANLHESIAHRRRSEEQTRRLQLQVMDAERARSAERESLRELKFKLTEASQYVARQQQEIRQLRELLTKQKQELTNALLQNASDRELRQATEADLRSRQTNWEQHENAVQALKERLAEQEIRASRNQEMLSLEVAETRGRSEQLAHELSASHTRLAQAEHEIKQLRKTSEQAAKELTETRDNFAQAQRTLHDLRTQSTQAELSFADLRIRSDLVEQKLATARDELAQITVERDHLRDSYPLRDLLASKESDIASLERELHTLDLQHPARKQAEEILRGLCDQRARLRGLADQVQPRLPEQPAIHVSSRRRPASIEN